MARRRLTAFALLAILIAGCEPAERDDAPDRPNIVFITVESLRADHVGCYGYTRETTPNLDALAATGTRYTQAHSVTSWTLTSHASMFTGLYPSAHRVILPQDRLADAHTTVAETLHDDGYQTAAIVSGPYLTSTFNLTQGFEHRDETPSSASNEAAHKDVTNPRMTAALDRFLRTKRDPKRPFFVFAYFWDVHYDYIPPPPYDTMFVPPNAEPIEQVQFGPIAKLGRDVTPNQLDYLVAQYDGEIRCTDSELGKLWSTLRELGLWENTAIVLTADHGEQFFEHSYLGHKHDLYAESLHVPLIVKLPGQTEGRIDERIVNLVDLHPTLLELAGCSTDVPYNGVSLFAESGGSPRTTFFELTTTWDIVNRDTGAQTREQDTWVAVRSGPYKLLHVRDTGFWQFYDVVADPGERQPLGPAFGEQALVLRNRLEQWTEAMGVLSGMWEEGPQATLSETELRRLRSLGYVP